MSAKNLDVVRRSRLEPKGCATESPLIGSYLVCALSQHPLGSSVSSVGAIVTWQQIHFGSSSDQPHRGR